MEIKELISFMSVVQQGNFSRAARKLGYSQAAITIQIQNLEEKLGTRLFDRLGKKISLTTSGRQFYEKIIPILNSLTDAGESLRVCEDLRGTLVIGATDSVCMSILPGLIREFHQLHPRVAFKIVTDTIDGLLKMLNSNEVDFVYLVDQRIYGKNWRTVSEKEIKVRFMAERHHEAVEKSPVRLEEIIAYPSILTEEDVSYRQLLDRELYERGLNIHPVIEAKNTAFILDMLMEGQEISFLPEYLLEKGTRYPDIRIMQVPDCQISVYLQILCHKNKWVSLEMRTFFDMILKHSD